MTQVRAAPLAVSTWVKAVAGVQSSVALPAVVAGDRRRHRRIEIPGGDQVREHVVPMAWTCTFTVTWSGRPGRAAVPVAPGSGNCFLTWPRANDPGSDSFWTAAPEIWL